MARNQKGEPFENFFRVSHNTIESQAFKRLPATAKVLYFTLCKLRNRLATDDGEFFRSDSTLEEDTGLSDRTVRKAKRSLSEASIIQFTKPKQQNKATRYLILETGIR